ncbi:TPA_asm: hypothetical protein G1X19_11090 [Salmonella enterica subsp. enterica serovar Typhimurium str. SL1344]|uniref:Uncharacterized protein n=1 Tax=Salmonella typhimurium (strain SL1344) TaxID=216597 RepID=A0A718RJR9_SALTS|nr:hypothetical protein [Salmonella enterica subsp. enterica serovar Typhimurium str. SL1344]HAD6692737.1 hypothetical protein [Salmonella enterica subsp. enterica serovar Typhimurium str. SL1344]HAD6716186.1 hypothetical protein [Salmonella enterica subsp. enterica serovar Typhimurium str. SL1344]
MAIADIPAEYFDEPFETWTGKLPALFLASTRTVPVSPHGQWRLASASCGGHREDIFPAAVLQLDIRQDMADVVRGIAGSAFTDEYLGYFELLPEAERRFILSDYSRYLGAAGLTCSEENLSLFSQDLYPLDATPENLHRLSCSACEAELESCRDGLVMFIIGPSDFPEC